MMRRVIFSFSLVASALFGCGGASDDGLYTEGQGAGSTSGLGTGEPEPAPPSGGEPPAPAGTSPPPASGGEPTGGDPPAGGEVPGKCKKDPPCAPLICNTKLEVCAVPGPEGTPCERDAECVSHE